jgi:hypothetical protein
MNSIKLIDGKYEVESAEEVQTIINLSPVQFKLCFTPQERIAIKKAVETDEMLADFWEILNDPKLTKVDLSIQSTKDAVKYLGSLGLIETSRVDEILSGNIK